MDITIGLEDSLSDVVRSSANFDNTENVPPLRHLNVTVGEALNIVKIKHISVKKSLLHDCLNKHTNVVDAASELILATPCSAYEGKLEVS